MRSLADHIDELGRFSWKWTVGFGVLMLSVAPAGIYLFMPLSVWCKVNTDSVYIGLFLLVSLVMVHSSRPFPLDDPSVFSSLSEVRKLGDKIVKIREDMLRLGALVFLAIVILSTIQILDANGLAICQDKSGVQVLGTSDLSQPLGVSRWIFFFWAFGPSMLGACMFAAAGLLVKICLVNLQILRMQSTAMQIRYRACDRSSGSDFTVEN